MIFGRKATLVFLLWGSLGVSQAGASSTTFTGALTGDDQVQSFPFLVTQNSQVLISTDSYGGGTMNGITTPAGGFVPVISLFTSNGKEIASDGGDETCSGAMKADPSTHVCDDASIATTLAAGSYTIALTEFFNVPVGPNLSNGFLEQGQGNFTAQTCSTKGAFYETDIAPCVQRTANFALTAATVPEPATLFLALPVLALAVMRRKRSLPFQS
jgi:hypothetical protein